MTLHDGDPKFDLRTLKRSLREGKITQKEVDDYVKKLSDEAQKAKEVVVFEEEAEGKRKSKRTGIAAPEAKEPTFALAGEP